MGQQERPRGIIFPELFEPADGATCRWSRNPVCAHHRELLQESDRHPDCFRPVQTDGAHVGRVEKVLLFRCYEEERDT